MHQAYAHSTAFSGVSKGDCSLLARPPPSCSSRSHETRVGPLLCMQPVCSAVLQCSPIRIDVRGAAKRQLRGFPHRRRNFSPTNDIHTTAFTATTASSTGRRHSADLSSRDRRPDARSVNLPPLLRPPQLRSDARRRYRTLHSPRRRHDDHTRPRRPGKGDLDIEETAQSICSSTRTSRHR